MTPESVAAEIAERLAAPSDWQTKKLLRDSIEAGIREYMDRVRADLLGRETLTEKRLVQLEESGKSIPIMREACCYIRVLESLLADLAADDPDHHRTWRRGHHQGMREGVLLLWERIRNSDDERAFPAPVFLRLMGLMEEIKLELAKELE